MLSDEERFGRTLLMQCVSFLVWRALLGTTVFVSWTLLRVALFGIHDGYTFARVIYALYATFYVLELPWIPVYISLTLLGTWYGMLYGRCDIEKAIVLAALSLHLIQEYVISLFDKTVLRGHKGAVSSIALSPDGALVATGSADATARLWDVRSGECRAILGRPLHSQGAVNIVAFSPDGSTLATSLNESRDRQVQLWDTTTGARLATLASHEQPVCALAFSPDGTVLATAADSPVFLWDAASGTRRASLTTNSNAGHAPGRLLILSLAFSPDGSRIATACDDKTACLWEVSTGICMKTLKGHTDSVVAVAFSPNGGRVATGSKDFTARLWNAVTGECVGALSGHTDVITAVAYSADGATLGTASADKSVRLWDAAAMTLRLVIGEPRPRAVPVQVDGGQSLPKAGDPADVPKGKHKRKKLDLVMRLRRDIHGALTEFIPYLQEMVFAVIFTVRPFTSAVSSLFHFFRDLDSLSARTKQQSKRITIGVHGTVPVTVYFDKERASMGSADELEPGRLLDDTHLGPVSSLAIWPDGTTLATTSLGTLRFWDVVTGEYRANASGRSGLVNSFAWSRDGRIMATANSDRTARVWEMDVLLKDHRITASSRSHADIPSSPPSINTPSGTNAIASTTTHGGIDSKAGPSVTVGSRIGASSLVAAVLAGHENDIVCISVSGDGLVVATGSRDKTARLWDAATGVCCATLRGHPDTVSSVAISPDGETVATVGTGRVRLWHTPTGVCRATLNTSSLLFSVVFSPDGATLAASVNTLLAAAVSDVQLWDVATGACCRLLSGHSKRVERVAFSPNGTRIVTGSMDHTARLWDVATGEQRQIFSGHTDVVVAVAIARSHKWAVSGGLDNTARLWSPVTGTALCVFGHSYPIVSVAVSPDGRTVLTSGLSKETRLWDAETGVSKDVLNVNSDVAPSHSAFLLNGDSSVFITAGCEAFVTWNPSRGDTGTQADADVKAVVLSFDNGEVTNASGPDSRAHKNTHTMLCLAFSADGQMFATGSDDGNARIWDLATRKLRATLKGHSEPVLSIAFSGDGKAVVTGSADTTARLWNASTGSCSKTFSVHSQPVHCVAFSRDGKMIASAGARDSIVHIWGTAFTLFNSNSKYQLCCPGPVSSLGFSPDGSTLVVASQEILTLWDVAKETRRVTLLGHAQPVLAVAFAHNGQGAVATGSADNTARVWDATGSCCATLDRGGHTDNVVSVAFSPDGKTIATASVDHTARLWDAATGTCHLVMRGHSKAVICIAFSADGRSVTTGSVDKTVRVWSPACLDKVHGARAPPTGRASQGMQLPESATSSANCTDDENTGDNEPAQAAPSKSKQPWWRRR